MLKNKLTMKILLPIAFTALSGPSALALSQVTAVTAVTPATTAAHVTRLASLRVSLPGSVADGLVKAAKSPKLKNTILEVMNMTAIVEDGADTVAGLTKSQRLQTLGLATQALALAESDAGNLDELLSKGGSLMNALNTQSGDSDVEDSNLIASAEEILRNFIKERQAGVAEVAALDSATQEAVGQSASAVAAACGVVSKQRN